MLKTARGAQQACFGPNCCTKNPHIETENWAKDWGLHKARCTALQGRTARMQNFTFASSKAHSICGDLSNVTSAVVPGELGAACAGEPPWLPRLCSRLRLRSGLAMLPAMLFLGRNCGGRPAHACSMFGLDVGAGHVHLLWGPAFPRTGTRSSGANLVAKSRPAPTLGRSASLFAKKKQIRAFVNLPAD